MIKVLQIINGEYFNGVTRLMSDVKNNISEDIEFEILTASNICDKWHNLNVNRKSLKGRIIYNYRLFKFLKKNKYDIIHINSGAFFFTFQVAIVAKLAGIKRLIAHSHNTPHISKIKRFLIAILNPIYRKMIDVKLTCSKTATKSLFTKEDDVIFIKNGIDIEEYKYNESYRNEYRKNFNIENNIVYGHVGKFDKQKNHDFLIDIFYEIQKKQDAVLLLIGYGELEDEIKGKVTKLNIKDKVRFLGFREDVSHILNAIDFFILPSLYEGLPICLIEAQTSGLPVFVSDAVTDEANISNGFNKIESNDALVWAEFILKAQKNNRENAYKDTIKNGFDIKGTTKQLEEIYINLINKNKRKGKL